MGGMEAHGGEGAHEASQGRRKDCVRKVGPVKMGALVMDQEADARTAMGEVLFWDTNLVKAKEEQVEVVSGSPWVPLLRLQAGAEGARVE